MTTQINLNIVVTPEALLALFSLFPNFNGKLNQIMATQAETAIQLAALVTQVEALTPVIGKIGGEIDASLTEILALKDLLAAAGNTDPAVTALIDKLGTRWEAVSASLNVLDLKVPDPVDPAV